MCLCTFVSLTISQSSMARILSILDADALDHVFAHVGVDYSAHLPIWLTCKGR